MKSIALILLSIFPIVGCDKNPSNNKADQPFSLTERYKIYFSPIVRADTFLVDTQTGRIWQQQLDSSQNPIWVEMVVKNREEKTIDFKDLK
ncbi:hypothetical protein [Chromobacterium sp.]|uniref:hypothetical protein n=1 Tax=Chromobacterium sp. TaxID=306190 RepID=UPI0035B3CF60